MDTFSKVDREGSISLINKRAQRSFEKKILGRSASKEKKNKLGWKGNPGSRINHAMKPILPS